MREFHSNIVGKVFKMFEVRYSAINNVLTVAANSLNYYSLLGNIFQFFD